jgi:hypothetical protein
MTYMNFNFNVGGGGYHHGGMHHGGMHHMQGYRPPFMGGGMNTSLMGYPGGGMPVMPYYNQCNNYSMGMIGQPCYNYYNPGFNDGGAVAGATTGAAFGSILGLGLSHGDPGIGLLTTLLGAGLGYSAGGNIGRHGCF